MQLVPHTFLDALEKKATLQANGQIRGNVYLTLANAHQVQGQYQRAEDFANQALSLSAEISSEPLRSDALKALADLAREQSHYQKALDYYQEYINTELNKRDELHQSAYVALDVARKRLHTATPALENCSAKSATETTH
ncbi:tetratricopeptide repeat protein [Vibrio sinaloensis]|nr:tetratricopeptide repeat protein [Vibrio sinaloensis]